MSRLSGVAVSEATGAFSLVQRIRLTSKPARQKSGNQESIFGENTGNEHDSDGRAAVGAAGQGASTDALAKIAP